MESSYRCRVRLAGSFINGIWDNDRAKGLVTLLDRDAEGNWIHR